MNKKEIIDQSLHFLYGMLAMLILAWLIGIYIAFPIVTGLALIREKLQHPTRSFWRLFNIDMAFVIAGQILCTLLLMM